MFESVTSEVRGHGKFVDLKDFCSLWLRWSPGATAQAGANSVPLSYTPGPRFLTVKEILRFPVSGLFEEQCQDREVRSGPDNTC